MIAKTLTLLALLLTLVACTGEPEVLDTWTGEWVTPTPTPIQTLEE